jgi:hypothetical protein
MRSTSAAYYADGRDKSSFDVPGKLKMKFSAMSPAGAYAPTTHAPSARRQFQVSIVLVVVLVLAAVALAMSTGRPWLGRLRPAKISVPHVAETLLDIPG